MTPTRQAYHKLKTYHVQSAGYADACGRAFVGAGSSRRSEQGCVFFV